jgi:hypothetical protein
MLRHGLPVASSTQCIMARATHDGFQTHYQWRLSQSGLLQEFLSRGIPRNQLNYSQEALNARMPFG